MDNQTFEGAELSGREKFKHLFGNKDIQFSKGKYDVYDGHMPNDEGGGILFEIKDRKVKSTTYQDDMLEFKKAKSLLDISKKHKGIKKVWYVNFFTDGIAIIYDILAIFKNMKSGKKYPKIVFDETNCNATTINNKGKINKKIIYLDKSYGTKYKIS